MFSELEKVMDFPIDHEEFLESLLSNVFEKKSADGIRQTSAFLKILYSFDTNNPQFAVFKYFWKIRETAAVKPLIAFVFAINNADILAESIQVLRDTTPGHKVAIETFEEEIEKYHPNQYSPNTHKSLAQNVASSWIQAGCIARNTELLCLF